MDKKSIIGLVLIFGIFIGYMAWISPTKEERAQMQRSLDSMVAARQDSIRTDSMLRAQTDSIQKALRDSILAVNPDATFDESSLLLVDPALLRQQLGVFGGNVALSTETIKVKNNRFDVDLVNKGASVNRVVLSQYYTFDSLPLELVSPNDDNMNMVFSTQDNRVINTKDMYFAPFVNGEKVEGNRELVVDGDSLVVAYRAYAIAQTSDSGMASNQSDSYLEFQYTFYPDSYEVGYKVNFHGLHQFIRSDDYLDFAWHNRMNRQEKVDQSLKGRRANRNKDIEKFNSNLYFKPIKDKVDNLRLGTDSEKNVKTSVEWIAFKQQFFCAILTGDQPFVNADLSTNTDKQDTAKNYLVDMRGTVGVEYDSEKDCSLGMTFFYGPSKYRDLRSMHNSYERMLPLGWGFFLIQWTSRLLVNLLNFLEQFNWNYGLIIILITLLLRIVLLPLVVPSYRTSAIMRILRPEMDALNKKYPAQEQAMQKQQEMMRLQKAAGANPMMGCLPMLIQLPILWAMFRFFPASIELRQKPFLWCDDLSTYDSIWDFGTTIPLYGDHMSLFCLLMFGVQFFYTWYTMKSQPQQNSMPGMKFMMYFMPFMMLFIFNNQSAALNLYYTISLSFTMIVMVLIRKFTNEDRVRAKMAAYELKARQKKASGNGKKSKFQQRLEEMQRMAEQAQKMQQQQQNQRK